MRAQDLVADPDEVRRRVREAGYAFVPSSAFRVQETRQAALEDLLAAWSTLPLDPYLRGGAYRRRRHGVYRCDPQGEEVTPIEQRGYFQSVEHNPFVGGTERTFAALPTDLATNPVLLDLLRFDAWLFAPLAGADCHGFLAHVHLVRVTADNQPGRPSPEGVHRDGFDFIALHHIGREGVTGGTTSLYDHDGSLVGQQTLSGRFASLYADDRRLRHDVSDLVTDNPTGGHRDMLLTSYTPI
ncbi:2OG-Fe dioxygenase family protein [Micromonospora sp. NPDC005172]|uniref:2OG-Fe dioxygenase family protein n=1 Tax=Micromonospora sp. NPDC005172 TaxID=3156867 RepID=UPI0033AB0822